MTHCQNSGTLLKEPTIEDVDIRNKLYTCKNCGMKYSNGKSASSLRMQYCGILCEISDLGFYINGFITNKLVREPSDDVVGIQPQPAEDIPDYEEEREHDDDDGRELIYV